MIEYGPGEIDIAPGSVISGARIIGPTSLVDARNVTFDNCEIVGSPVAAKGGLILLGGRANRVTGCIFSGGIQAGQLSIGLNLRATGAASLPYDWTVEGCEFEAPDGQWGTYPQTHHIYNLADPSYPQNGRIVDCTFSGHPYGYNVKIGGTGNQPHTEGSRGVVVEGCRFNGVLNGGRACTLLMQGEKSEASIVDCTFTASGGAVPYVEAAQGARMRIAGAGLPQGVVEYASWYYLRVFSQSKKATVPAGVKPPNIGGISWV